MILTHYRDSPIREIWPVSVNFERMINLHQIGKPSGLWVTVDGPDDWLQWCRENDFRLETLTHVYDVHLKPTANMLVLTDADAILAFTDMYRVPLYSGLPYDVIDWSKVMEVHQGIVIAPYCHELRLDRRTYWYYGWDCASGCIWDADAVEKIELRCVQPQPEPIRWDDDESETENHEDGSSDSADSEN